MFGITLNKEQQKAVDNLDGALLVLAGAGTGKTRVITSRILNILQTQSAFPSEILAVTFTNKASHEMKTRVEQQLGCALDSLWLGTFHSIAAKILRTHAEAVGLKRDFIIIDVDDRNRILAQILADLGIDKKNFPVKNYGYVIDKWKDKAIKPYDAPDSSDSSEFAPKVKQVYELYQKRLAFLNSVDFGDILFKNLDLFRQNPEIAEMYQNKFKYVLVDEYQDTNFAQYLWLKYIAGHGKKKQINICCVGDDDQSIYGWRGAEIKNILNFEKDYPKANIIRLEQNYRSTKNILDTASHLISKNKGRHEKVLRTEKNNLGEKVKLVNTERDYEEVHYVGTEIQNLIKDFGVRHNEIAVLVRAGYQTRLFEEKFVAMEIPYKVVGGLKFYDRSEIKDAIAYLRLVVNNNDSMAFERIVNKPRRGIGSSTISKILAYSEALVVSAFTAAKLMCEHDEIKGKSRLAMMTLIKMIEKYSATSGQVDNSMLATELFEESGFIAFLKQDKTPEAEGRVENVQEFVRGLDKYPTIAEFLEYVSLVNDKDTADDASFVNIMTIHAAKGLEFDTVFLPGWEDGTFPSRRSLEERNGLEEERRLAYVAITRAKKRLYISHSDTRYEYGRVQATTPSRFISDLPSEPVEKISPKRKYSGGYKTERDFDEDVMDYIQNKGWGRERDGNNSYGYRKQHNLAKSQYNGFANKKSMEFFQQNGIKSNVQETTTGTKLGQKVKHKKFGRGTVLMAEDNKVTVSFDEYGIKTIMANFVEVE